MATNTRTYLRSDRPNKMLSTTRPNCSQIVRSTIEISQLSGTSSLPKILVIMTYNRIENLRLVLISVSDMMFAAAPYHTPLELIVTQSVDEDIPEFTKPVEQFLETLRTAKYSHAFKSIQHIQVPIQKKDQTSFTNDMKLYGNKKNSMNNLIHGLQIAVDKTKKETSSNIMIMEDDVILSCDVLEYFSYASSLMIDTDESSKNNNNNKKNNNNIVHYHGNLDVASTELVSRPSFFIGNRDTDYFFKTTNPSSTITISANSRTVVKTYAWMLSKTYANEYLHALIRIHSSEGSDGINEPTKTLNGCYYCEPYCYDHVAEWTLAKHGRKVMYPSIPRVTQTLGKGMTYSENPITPIYQLFIPAEKWNQNGLTYTGESIIKWFDLPGNSAWINHGPSMGYYVATISIVLMCLLICFTRMKIKRIRKRRSKNVRMKRR